MMTLEQIEMEAMKLTPDERISLVDALLDSVDEAPDLHPDWIAEIRRRAAEIEDGRATLIPAEEVFREIRAALRR